MSGFRSLNNSASKRVLNLLEPVKLTLWKVMIKRVTVVEFRVNYGGGNGAGCFEVKVWADTAKLTDRNIAESAINADHRDAFCFPLTVSAYERGSAYCKRFAYECGLCTHIVLFLIYSASNNGTTLKIWVMDRSPLLKMVPFESFGTVCIP